MILDTLMQKFGSISISDIRIAVMADNDMYRYNICSLNISTLIKKSDHLADIASLLQLSSPQSGAAAL